MAEDHQEFCLRWNNHQSNLVSAFHDLRIDEDFVDVTLACEGQSLYAHKVVLSACSPFFRDILKKTPCKHPVIVLKDILYHDLVALVEFMYMGEVKVKHLELPSFLRTAEVLRVRGLTESSTSKLKTFNLGEPEIDNLDVPTNLNNPSTCSMLQNTLPRNELTSTQNSSDFSLGVDNSRSDSTGHLADVKVEEVDLDSVSDDDNDTIEANQTFEFRKLSDIVTVSDEKKRRHGSANNSNQPLITLQSFARIPSLASQDIIPSFVQNLVDDFPISLNEGNQPHEMPTGLESDCLSGRTPGRASASDRPRWPCPFCMRLLSSRSSVRRHIEDRHTNDTSRHPCPLCERLYRTRNSLQYHLSTAHRDREPGPRGRPRTRPRTPLTTESTIASNKSPDDGEIVSSRSRVNSSTENIDLNHSPSFGLPPA